LSLISRRERSFARRERSRFCRSASTPLPVAVRETHRPSPFSEAAAAAAAAGLTAARALEQLARARPARRNHGVSRCKFLWFPRAQITARSCRRTGFPAARSCKTVRRSGGWRGEQCQPAARMISTALGYSKFVSAAPLLHHLRSTVNRRGRRRENVISSTLSRYRCRLYCKPPETTSNPFHPLTKVHR